MTVKQEVACDLMINYENASSSWLKLTGFFDLENATLEGTFVSSQDLVDFLYADPTKLNYKNTYKLVSLELQDSAITVFSSTDFKDAQFCDIVEQSEKAVLGSVFVIGNMMVENKGANKLQGYRNMQLDLVDLNIDVELPQNARVYTDRKRRVLNFSVTKNFMEVADEVGRKVLPYYMLQSFRMYIKSQHHLLFKSQMFYQDPIQNIRKILFIQGDKKEQRLGAQELPSLPQWPGVMTENYSI